MGKIQQYWVLTGVLIVALLGAGWFFGQKPQAAKAAHVKTQTASQISANKSLQGEIKLLQDQADGILAKRNRLRQIDAILPNNPALPRLIRSISTFTTDTGIDLTAMTPGVIVDLVDAPAAVAKTAAPADAAATDAKSPAAAAAPRASSTAGTLSQQPVTLALNGDFSQVQMFLGRLEKLDRAFVVDKLTIEPMKDTGVPATGTAAAKKKASNALTVTIVGRTFIKTPPAVAAAPITAPAASTTKK
jgi:Tfp pilus assembly protein PilO